MVLWSYPDAGEVFIAEKKFVEIKCMAIECERRYMLWIEDSMISDEGMWRLVLSFPLDDSG
jgi:hypothetical protein